MSWEIVTNPFYRDPANIPQYAAVGQITKLKTEVSIGGSVVIGSDSLDLNVTSAWDQTIIWFMYLDPNGGADPYEAESFDVPFSFAIRRRNGKIRLNSKSAGRAWNSPVRDVDLSDWFQRPNPRIRVDVKESDYEVFIDGRKFQTWPKTFGNKNFTHIRYLSYPEDVNPALSRALTVTTYTSIDQVPSV